MTVRKLILGVDTETTGVDNPDKERIIEVGLCLFDFETKKPLDMCGFFVKEDDLESLSPEVSELTGIDFQDLLDLGVSGNHAVERIESFAKRADFIMAHNATFDKGMLKALYTRVGFAGGGTGALFEKQWLCSLRDIEYPKQMKSRGLNYLACDHGFLNPFKHRAVMDVLTMVQLVSHYDLTKMVELSLSPLLKIKANVSFDQRNLAKDCGFKWDPKNKQWWKEIKEIHLKTEKDQYQFQYEVLSTMS